MNLKMFLLKTTLSLGGVVEQNLIFTRLDMVLVNVGVQDWFAKIKVEHLARPFSDHAPLFLILEEMN